VSGTDQFRFQISLSLMARLVRDAARKIEISVYVIKRRTRERVSEVDLMTSKYLLSFLRQLAAAAERALQRAFGSGGSLIPIPIRTVVNQRRLDQRRSRD